MSSRAAGAAIVRRPAGQHILPRCPLKGAATSPLRVKVRAGTVSSAAPAGRTTAVAFHLDSPLNARRQEVVME